MATAKITLIGTAKYLNALNDDLFKYFTLPEGIDTDTVINNILLTGGEFEVLYSSPYFMQEAIKTWSAKWNHTFSKWYNALQLEYEPIENYDRHEEWTDNGSGTTTSESTSSGSSNTTNTSDNFVTAYDSDTLHKNNEDTSTGTGSVSNSANAETSNSSTGTHTGRVHGNIGVTTSQQMLQSELDISKWNLANHITDIFIREFCILVY